MTGPLKTPEPNYDAKSDTEPQNKSKTGEYRLAVDKVSLITNFQWGAIAAVVVAFGILLNNTLTKIDVVNNAMAQNRATVEADHTAFTNHLVTDTADKVIIKDNFEEGRKDTKALYDYMRTHTRQARLEKDGGTDE